MVIKVYLKELEFSESSFKLSLKELKGACHVTEIYRNFNKRRGHLS